MNSRNLIRYRQRDFCLDDPELARIGWNFARFGCGPTSVANVLANLGFSIGPLDAARKILCFPDGQFNKTYLHPRGIAPDGLIYCLGRFIKEDSLPIQYKIQKIDFTYPQKSKSIILDYFKSGWFGIIHVGPSPSSPLTFSNFGHYLVLCGVNQNDELYVINSNSTGDHQIGQTFTFETIIQNMLGRPNSFNFLLINKKEAPSPVTHKTSRQNGGTDRN